MTALLDIDAWDDRLALGGRIAAGRGGTRFDGEDELVDIVNRSENGLSLGILTKDVMRGLPLAERLPSGIVHINDQTVDDESVAPFGGVAASGTGARFGGFEANAEAFTETRWITAQGDIERYPF